MGRLQAPPSHGIASLSTPTISIAGRAVGREHAPFVIAEVAQAHDGSLGTAHAYIDAIARAGADAVKFQTHIAEAESTPGEPFRVNVFPQDASRYEYWKRMEFTPAQWAELANHARQRGLVFLSTPFSMQAVDLLDRLEMPAWKVGSGEVTNLPMLERMARTGRPVLLSSGMSPWSHLDVAASAVRGGPAPLAIFQCTTSYPCPPERVGLNVISEIERRYQCPAGLSDHSGAIHASVAAVALGASLIEVHVVFSKECFGPDVTSSVTTTELKNLVDGVRFVSTAVNHPVDKDGAAEQMTELRRMFGKSVVAAENLPVGRVLAEGDLTVKKPGTGIEPARLKTLLGRRLKRAVQKNAMLADDDLS
jgi:N,N'-diacetyllegionaminate synthase